MIVGEITAQASENQPETKECEPEPAENNGNGGNDKPVKPPDIFTEKSSWIHSLTPTEPIMDSPAVLPTSRAKDTDEKLGTTGYANQHPQISLLPAFSPANPLQLDDEIWNSVEENNTDVRFENDVLSLDYVAAPISQHQEQSLWLPALTNSKCNQRHDSKIFNGNGNNDGSLPLSSMKLSSNCSSRRTNDSISSSTTKKSRIVPVYPLSTLDSDDLLSSSSSSC